MTQIHPFGPLRFQDPGHEWALGFGLALGHWIINPSTSKDTVNGWMYKASEFGLSLESLREYLLRIDYSADIHQPAREEYVDSVYQHITRTSTHHSDQYYPVVVVGVAAGLLQNSTVFPQCHELARKQVLQLPTHCTGDPLSEWDGDLVFSRLSPTVGSQDDVRNLLIDLQGRLTVLMVLANSSKRSKLNLDKEREHVETSLNDANADLVVLANESFRTFQRYLREKRPHIVHFSGHGGDGQLDFCKKGIWTKDSVDIKDIVKKLNTAAREDRLRCVIFNACSSFENSVGESAVGSVGIFIAMDHSIYDSSAILFSKHLYYHLDTGLTFHEAYAEARTYVQRYEERDREVMLQADLTPEQRKKLENKPLFSARITKSYRYAIDQAGVQMGALYYPTQAAEGAENEG